MLRIFSKGRVRISFKVPKRSGYRSIAVRCSLLLGLMLPGPKTRADMTLLIESPINFLGHVSSAGHAALLIESLCSDDHVHMRWCHANENGTVVSRYKGIGAYVWVAMPPGPYLFAVDASNELPEIAGLAEVDHLRALYRMRHPESFDCDPTDDSWIQLLGAAYRRRILCVHVRTNASLDDRLMQWFHSRPDRTHFNLFFPIAQISPENF